MSDDINIKAEADLIWNTADDILRDVFTRTEYPDIIYPMVLIRRIECVLEDARDQVREQNGDKLKKLPKSAVNDLVKQSCGFNNKTKWTLKSLTDESETALKDNFVEKFRDAISPEDAAVVEHYLNEVQQDDELIMDVHSNLDDDPAVVFEEIIKDKLYRRFTDYIINHAAERYEKLQNEKLLGFVQRNAYSLLRQAAQSRSLGKQ